MNKFILSLVILFSTSLAHAMVWPQVYNWGNRVEVQIHNRELRPISCSGSIRLLLESGESETHFHYSHVPGRSFSTRSYYTRSFNDRIRRVNHSIFCH
jgi:hypothetical protein